MSAPRSFGDYELLEEIGRGGMGIVYRARQVSLDRIVAVKMLLFGPLAKPEHVQRFRTEAAAAASLQHPNIVAIHEVGFRDGQHFFAMDYVAGRSLADIVRDGPLPAQRAAGCVKSIAEAIQYAHDHGILHRDLKPSNVLVDEHDQPKVTDFGLAKRLEEETELTLSGQVLGSPSYMPPEQAVAHRGLVGKRSDVYSLGAILYHLLTGRAPFVAPTVGETLRQVQTAEPVSPTVLNPHLPRDLRTICLRCLEKEPVRRYQTAQALAEDLGRWLRKEPILARPASRPEKAWRWCRRKPVPAGLLAALVLVTLLGGAGVLLQWRRAERTAVRELEQRRRAEAGERLARQQAYTADMNLAFQAVADNNLGRARQLLERHDPSRRLPAAPSSTPAHDPRGWEWRYLWQLTRSDDLFVLGRHENFVTSATFTADGQGVISGSQDRTLRLWDRRTRECVATLNDQRHIRMVTLSPDGRWLVSGDSLGEAVIWDLQTRQIFAVFTNSPPVVSVAITPDKRFIAAASFQALTLWNTRTKEVVARRPIDGLPRNRWMPLGLAFSPNGKTLAYDPARGAIHLVQLDTQAEHALPRAHLDMVLTLAFSPDGRTLVSGSQDHTVRVWELAREREIVCLTNHGSFVASAAFSPDGRTLATTGADQRIRLWETATWQETAVFKGHQNEVWSVAFSPDGQHLVTASKDETVRIWSATSLPEKTQLLDPPRQVASAHLSSDGTMVFLVYNNGTCSFVDIPSLRSTVPSAAPSRDQPVAIAGQRVAFARSEGQLWLWSATTLQAILLGGPGPAVLHGVFSLNGRRLAVARADRSIEVWDVAGTNQVLRGQIQTDVYAVALSPDGNRVALGLRENVAELWSTPERRRLVVLKGHKGGIFAIQFSSDGARVATISPDGLFKIWDARTGQLQATLSGELRCYTALAFSPDLSRIAASGTDGTVTVWDLTATEPQEVARLGGWQRNITALAFLADHNTLAGLSADTDGFRGLCVWRAPSFAEIQLAGERSGPVRPANTTNP